MTKEQILNEVATSKWQPEFEVTDNLDAVVDSILKPHEDYFLGLHSKVKEIILRGIECANELKQENVEYTITFGLVCNWQKELFEHKKELIEFHYNNSSHSTICPDDLDDEEEDKWYVQQKHHTDCYIKSKTLSNLHINLGLRQTNVKVGDWNPPHPMFLEDLKEMCFPVKVENSLIYLPNNNTFIGGVFGSKQSEFFSEEEQHKMLLYQLTYWYKIFQTCHYFSDLNGRMGGIVINILSYILTNKYLIRK